MTQHSSPQNEDREPDPYLSPSAAPTSTPEAEAADFDSTDHQTRNFALLVLFQVVQRVGWIFKTESVIMPAVLDYLGGSGMVRGWLPLLNRICQSFPTLVLATSIRNAPRKKIMLCWHTILMSACFGILAICFWIASDRPVLLQVLFLGIYGLFFFATGMNQVLFSTIQGKLIVANRRGRLMLVANLIGVCAAVGAVWLLMPQWVSADRVEFANLFVTSSVAFFVATAFVIALREPADKAHVSDQATKFAGLAEIRTALKEDFNFRKLAIVSALFGSSIILFPHYQALGRGEQLGGNFRSLLVWLTIQNIGTAAFSFVFGPVADRKGNLLALRLVLAGIVVSPGAAIAIAELQIPWLFPLVFVLVGLTPVMLRLLMNYTLEASPPEKHASYLATINVATGIPVLASPLAGSLVDQFGYAPIFGGVTLCGATGWWLSGRLKEPRNEKLDR